MTNHGLSRQQVETIKRILATYANEITQVDLFGSRATGSYRPNSDVDLLLHGSLTEEPIDRLWTLFHESNLPFSVDVKGYELTTYPPLKIHMDKVRKRLFTQQALKEISLNESVNRPGFSGGSIS